MCYSQQLLGSMVIIYYFYLNSLLVKITEMLTEMNIKSTFFFIPALSISTPSIQKCKVHYVSGQRLQQDSVGAADPSVVSFLVFDFNPVWKDFICSYLIPISVTDLYPDTISYIFMMSVSITILSGKNYHYPYLIRI